MLLGSEIGAALAVLESFQPDVIGLNCATGPAEMNDAVRYLCQNSTVPISVLPNAGLPQNEGGHAVYKLTPAELATFHRRFVSEYGVQVVGGCCGTTPEHLRAVVEAVEECHACSAQRAVRNRWPPAPSALVPLEVDGQPVVIAEEMNTTTRLEHFRNMVRAGDYDGILALAKRLVAEGSQMLDLCCAIVGRRRSRLHECGARENRHARARAHPGRLHRGQRHRGSAEAHSRQAHHQLHQPGRRRKAHQPGAAHGAALRRRGYRAHHRRAGHGPHRRQEGRHRPSHSRSGRQQVRPALRGSDFRCAHAAHLHRPGRLPLRGHRNPRSRAPHQAGTAAMQDRARRLEHLLRPECLCAPRAQQRVSQGSRRSRARLRHHQLRQNLSALQDS